MKNTNGLELALSGVIATAEIAGTKFLSVPDGSATTYSGYHWQLLIGVGDDNTVSLFIDDDDLRCYVNATTLITIV